TPSRRRDRSPSRSPNPSPSPNPRRSPRPSRSPTAPRRRSPPATSEGARGDPRGAGDGGDAAGCVRARVRDRAGAPARPRGGGRAGQPVNVEFVSANPTGPLHVGHGRQAALGDAIAAVLEWTGWRVTREFYYNDGGAQIANLARSVQARIRELRGQLAALPE